jgi:hypothetical protein
VFASFSDTCPCSKIYRISESSSATIELAGATLDGPQVLCAPRLKRVQKGRVSLTQPRPMDCGGSGRATFVAIMQVPDLWKCDDLASGWIRRGSGQSLFSDRCVLLL